MNNYESYNLFNPLPVRELSELAKNYIDHNLSVIPTKEDKSPMINWADYQKERMTNGNIVKHFMNAHSIGIICGKISENLEVIDVDCKYDSTGQLAKDLFGLLKDNLPDIFDRLVIASTKNKGWHIYYRCGIIEGNKKLAVNLQGQVLIETRGEGGYVIAPVSPGYSLKQGSLDNIPLISSEEREILLFISRTFDEKPQEPIKEYSKEEQKYSGLSPFDDYNNRAEVLDLLAQHGWQISKELGDRVHLTRPGKQKGNSGNWHKVKRVLYVFSSSTQFEQEKGYNATGIYCLLECNGDFTEAGKKLYDAGYGDRRTSLKSKNKSTVQTEPIPLLPIDGFPQQIQNWIITCADIYGTPRDFWAGGVIATTALAIGDKLELKTKYENVPIFWTCIVGDVSSGKTEPQKLLLNPVKKLDDLSFEKYKAEKKEYERILGLTKAERIEEGISELIKPVWFQYRTKDATPEAMAGIHEINTRGFIIDREELNGWLEDFGRYNKSGEQSNMLSTWSQVPYINNRKSSEPINIPKPVIHVFGGMQPDLLLSLSKDNRAENGFVSRMCFVYPDNSKKQNYNEGAIPPELYCEWERFIHDLLAIPEATRTVLTPDAQATYKAWFNKNACKINDEPNQHLKGVYGKLDIISLRLAIVIKGMKLIHEGDCESTISAEIMKAALDITEYFRATAIKVYQKMFTTDINKINKADAIQWVLSNLNKTDSEIARFFETSRSQVFRKKDKTKEKD